MLTNNNLALAVEATATPIYVSAANDVQTIDETIVDTYVQQFSTYSRKSEAAIIGMGEVVYSAKNLAEDDYKQFCAGIKYSADSKALVKFASIGKKANTFNKYISQLPISWTTIYILSQLDEADISELAEKSKFSVTTTGDEAQALVSAILQKPATSNTNSKAVVVAEVVAEEAIVNRINFADTSYSIGIQFSVTPTKAEVTELTTFILAYSEKTKCSMQFTEALEKLVADFEAAVESEA